MYGLGEKQVKVIRLRITSCKMCGKRYLLETRLNRKDFEI